MASLLAVASVITGALSCIGHVQGIVGTTLLARFRQSEDISVRQCAQTQRAWPPVSILKPLYGDEPLLEETLEGFFQLDYPDYELVFGIHHADDPALAVAESLRERYPHHHVSIIVDSAEHGPNRKIGNLINLSRACRHDLFVISDSDIHVCPTYLKQVVETLEKPGTELVTALYAGLPASTSIVRQFSAYNINVNFLPGVMMSRLLGRRDCLGATMALKRENLARIGGFQALVNHVADDSVLGQLIRKGGGTIRLAPTLCLTTVTETGFAELISHELRWGRTVRSIEPIGYALSSLQLPLFWASLCVLCTPSSRTAWAVLGVGWILRGILSTCIARLTKCRLPGIFPLLIVRDWLSAAIMIGSARGSRVAWRGQTVHISRRKNLTRTQQAPHKTPPVSETSRMNRSVRS